MPSRDNAEEALALVVEKTTRTFLQRVLDAVLAAIRSGRTDDAQPVLALGVLMNWWTDEVSDRVVESIRESWQAAFGVATSVSPRSDAMAFHIAAVRDRLSRSALPEIPEAAFDQVRLSMSVGTLGGWGTEQRSRDIAERLAWEPDKTYWEEQKALAENEIDKILDPLGKPGSDNRVYAHMHDPHVKVWQAVRAEAVDKIKEHEGDWKVRATRIARTEATASWNSGSLAALAAEGRPYKRWLAHIDDRTRESHKDADGQVVPLSRPFHVGKSLLMMPGDPAAPPWETINCRCTIVGADEPGTKALTAGGGEDQVRVPAGNGHLSGRWLDMPGTILASLPTFEPALPTVDTPVGDLVAGDGVVLEDTVHEVTKPVPSLTTRNTETNETAKHNPPKTALWKKVVLPLAAALMLAGIAVGGVAQAEPQDVNRPPDVTTSEVVTVPAPTTVTGYRDMFATVDTAEWGAADVGLSVDLPSGQRVWLYGDTLSGTNGFVHSTAITQDGGTLHVSHGGQQLLPDKADNQIYWIEGAKPVGGNKIAVDAALMDIGTNGPWDFTRHRPDAHRAIVVVDPTGDVTFDHWATWVPGNPPSTYMKVLEPHHYQYNERAHPTIVLDSGRVLYTYSQNWDDSFENHKNADGSIRYSDWATIFSSGPDRTYR